MGKRGSLGDEDEELGARKCGALDTVPCVLPLELIDLLSPQNPLSCTTPSMLRLLQQSEGGVSIIELQPIRKGRHDRIDVSLGARHCALGGTEL